MHALLATTVKTELVGKRQQGQPVGTSSSLSQKPLAVVDQSDENPDAVDRIAKITGLITGSCGWLNDKSGVRRTERSR